MLCCPLSYGTNSEQIVKGFWTIFLPRHSAIILSLDIILLVLYKRIIPIHRAALGRAKLSVDGARCPRAWPSQAMLPGDSGQASRLTTEPRVIVPYTSPTTGRKWGPRIFPHRGGATRGEPVQWTGACSTEHADHCASRRSAPLNGGNRQTGPDSRGKPPRERWRMAKARKEPPP
jgi:hypothetical protein